MRLRLPLTATLLAAALTLSACGGGGSSDSSGSEGGSATTEAPSSGGSSGGGEVEIADFAYDPAELEAKVGDTITFTNSDSAKHTATSAKGAPAEFDTGDIDGDGTAEITVDEAGDYEYFCSIHEYMKGTIRVLE